MAQHRRVCVYTSIMVVPLVACLLSMQTVMYEGSAGPASAVLPTFGKAIGMTLRTAGVAGKLPLYLNVRGQEPRLVLDEIAAATGCTWERDKDALILRLDVPKLEREDAAGRTTWLKEEAQRLSAAYSSGALSDSAFDGLASAMIAHNGRVPENNRNDPTGRAKAGILNSTLLPQLAKMKPGERILFVDNPNRFQQKLPAEAAAVLESLRSDTERLLRAASTTVPEYLELSTRYAGTGGKKFVVAKRALGSDRLHLLLGISGAGLSVLQFSSTITLTPPRKLPPLEIADLPLIIDPETALLGRWIVGRSRTERLGKTLLDKLSDPRRIDPHDLLSRPILNAVSRGSAKSIVACLPDECLIRLSGIATEKASLKNILSVLNQDCAITLSKDAIVIAHRSRLATLGTLLDRTALFDFVARANREGGVSLANYAAFSSAVPMRLRWGESWSDGVVRALVPFCGDAYAFDESILGVTLIGKLTTAEIRVLATDGLPLAKLNTEAQAAIAKGLLGNPADDSPPSLRMLLMDPSEAFSDELVDRWFMHLTAEQAAMYQRGDRRYLAGEVARDLRDKGSLSTWATQPFQPVLSRTFSFRWDFGPDNHTLSMSMSGIDERLPFGSQATLATAPDFWKNPRADSEE
jgi:hypothetical protein